MDCQLQCKCGNVQGQLHDVRPATVTRAVCYCKFCQAYQTHLGNADTILDAQGGTDIIQISPRQIIITSGIDNVHCIKLTEKGAFRFYAKCCNTPIANTAQNLNIPFAAVNPAFVVDVREASQRDAILGPVSFRVNGRGEAYEKLDKTDAWSRRKTLLKIAFRMVLMAIRKDVKQSPFRNKEGQPIVMPERVRVQL